MFVVIIHNEQGLSTEREQRLAAALQVTQFDARQRLTGDGPRVIATFIAQEPAQGLLSQLQQAGFSGFVLNAAQRLQRESYFPVRRFRFGAEELRLETSDGRSCALAYPEVERFVLASRIAGHNEIETVTERKFSVGKTLLAGGVPMTKKVKRQELVAGETRESVLFLIAAHKPRCVCACNGMSYDGLGEKMQLSRELNFNLLVDELRQRCPQASFNNRLLKRSEQVKLLGPLLKPESNLDLAVEILAHC